MKTFKTYIVSCALLSLATVLGCSGSSPKTGDSPLDSTSAMGSTTLDITLKETSIVSSTAAYTTPSLFRVTVTGEGLIEPIVEQFPPDAGQIEVAGIPYGAVVDIRVEAVNQNGVVYKRGIAENIAIDSDRPLRQVPLAVRRVPIFTTLIESSLVFADRLHFEVCAEPGHEIALFAAGDDGRSRAVENRNAADSFIPDADCLLRVDPQGLAEGRYIFTLLDEDSHESSSFEIEIQKATQAYSAQFTAGTSVGSMRYEGDLESTHLLETWE